MKKRVWAGLLAAAMLVSLLSTMSLADEGKNDEDGTGTYTLTMVLYTAESAEEPETKTVEYDTVTEVDLSGIEKPTRDGYAFTGWYEAPDPGADATALEKVTVDGDRTIYAGWKKTYTLTMVLYTPESAEAPETKTAEYDANTEVDLSGIEKPTREGYTFTDWYETADPDANATALEKVTMDGDQTIYAGWEQDVQKYTLTVVYSQLWFLNGLPDAKTTEYPAGTVLDLDELEVPEWEGNTFTGWYEEISPDASPLETVTMDKDWKIYAGWIEGVQDTEEEHDPTNTLHYVTYDGDKVPVQDQAFATACTVTLSPAEVTQPGYTFTGWYKDAACTDGPITELQIPAVTEDTDTYVYAGWTAGGTEETCTLTLVYDPMWQIIGVGDQDVQVEFAVGTTVILDRMDFPGHEGKEYTWYTDSGLDTIITEVTLNEDTTICAGATTSGGGDIDKGDGKGFHLSYHSNNGSYIRARKFTTATYVDFDDPTYIPEREGYTFNGWYTDFETVNDPAYRVSGVQKISKTTTVVAGWLEDGTAGGSGSKTVTPTPTTSPLSGETVLLTVKHICTDGAKCSGKDKDAPIDRMYFYVKDEEVNLYDLAMEETWKGHLFANTFYLDSSMKKGVKTLTMSEDQTVYAVYLEEGGNKGSVGDQTSSVPELLAAGEHTAYLTGFSDGTIRPMSKLSRGEVASLFYRLLGTSAPDTVTEDSGYTDVAGSPYGEAIAAMTDLGLMNGRGDGIFDPEGTITRAEFVAICARFDSGETEGVDAFSDIGDCWAKEAIQRAAALGWVKGMPDGTFHPADEVTRCEAAAILNRMLGRTAEDLPEETTAWPDNPEEAWYYQDIQLATATWAAEEPEEPEEA